jgi:Na+/H+ antiporter NhaD/arsenite permease-like protein
VNSVALAVFAAVYIGMILGRWPGLAIDRTGIALLGAIVLVATETISPAEAWHAADVPTLGLLFGLMVVSAQFRLAGAYSAVTRRVAAAHVSPEVLLGLIIAVAALLSAGLANDIVCLAMAPLIVEACAHRGLAPVPFLLGLACAANIGSAATLIGNPQNMLIGQSLRLSFSGYLLDGLVPALLGNVAAWGLICRQWSGRWEAPPRPLQVEAPPFNPWQAFKGAAILAGVLVCFLVTQWPREVVALAAGGLLLTSRRMHTRHVLGLVDWHLLVLFFGLFVVNHALQDGGGLQQLSAKLRAAGVDLDSGAWLFASTVLLSNVVSNVPAVMLLLPMTSHPQAGAILALASTLAGNLFVVGSIANIIVIDQAGQLGVGIGWREHARTGVPVTAVTLAIAAAWLWLRGSW